MCYIIVCYDIMSHHMLFKHMTLNYEYFMIYLKELLQLAEIRAQLREQRALALEARRRGNELQE